MCVESRRCGELCSGVSGKGLEVHVTQIDGKRLKKLLGWKGAQRNLFNK